MTVAQVLSTLIDGELPFRFSAFDGSVAGPPEAALGVHLVSSRALNYFLNAPGDLGLARAYVAGDLEFSGLNSSDPYPMLALMADALHVRRPTPAQLLNLARSLGWKQFVPVAPPAQEAPPRWRRATAALTAGSSVLTAMQRHSKQRDSDSIHRHYDVSNEFYEYVLGPSMAYTCAVYDTETTSLEQAQENKYRLIFDKLRLTPGQRLLDIGCGWGSMVRYAARQGISVLGVTLSAEQASWGQQAIIRDGLESLAEIRYLDYRDVPETGFDAISSIGLTEHIGVDNYASYFAFLTTKLADGGRLLNHCITRPDNFSQAKTEAFIDRYVFPDGELTGSGRIITDIQDAGLEVRHSENLREHYALTLRDWCINLAEHWDECVAEVGAGTARVWALYMAGSRMGFERNAIQLHQVLAVKPGLRGDAGLPLRPWWS
nr:class I SAM-dependent methyltransferase [Nakamurella antarctica]